MNKPNVVLKSVKTFKGHDGIGVNADIYINGIKCIAVHDGAYGGELEITYLGMINSPEHRKVNEYIEQLLLYIDTLKDINSVEDYLNELINEYLKAKDQKKFEKKCENGICVGIPGEVTYGFVKTKKPLKSYNHNDLQTIVNQISLTYCKKGVVILNKNLTELGIKLI